MSNLVRQEDPRITPVILSGGVGNRLWPLSRSARPKQLLALTGPGSMLQTTIERVSDAARFTKPLLVVSDKHLEILENQLEPTAASASTLILEPEGRNTAPAIALAALSARGDDLLLVMPSDHLIGDTDAFLAAIEAAAPLAADGWLVTFGIVPTRAETGYGYIKEGARLNADASRVERFVEKPDAARAAAYLASGGYQWNAGIFLFRGDAFIEALAAHAPEVLDACQAAMAHASRSGRHVRPGKQAFAAAPSISIDHAVMERSDRIAVVPMRAGWSDVGSWQSLHEVSLKDGQGNACSGDVALVQSSGCLIRSEGPLVVAIGVQDLAIIATGDALLVVPRGNDEAVREAIELLKARSDHRL